MSFIPGVHVPAQPKNLAINGNFDFWQRVENAGAGYNTSSTTNVYIADMIQINLQGSSVKQCTIQQSSDVPTVAQSGFKSVFSYSYTNSSSITPASSDFMIPFQYNMEGVDYAKIHGKNATFGFWIKASVAGIYNFNLFNHNSTRGYVTTFPITGANTWQFVSITIAMDSLDTSWVFDNTRALCVCIGGVQGSTYTTASLSTWQSPGYGSTTATNWMATAGATLNIAQFSIVAGAVGFGATGFQRAGADWGQELSLCQRYYEKSFDIGQAPINGGAGTLAVGAGNTPLAAEPALSVK